MFYELARMLAGRDSRKIRPNTYLLHEADAVAVRFHATVIARAYADGRIWLNSGGWQTVTTKDRLNHVLPAWLGVFQRDFVWYVRNSLTGTETPFSDGMTLTAWGEVLAA